MKMTVRKSGKRVFVLAAILAGICLAGCSQMKPQLKEYSKQYLDYFDTFSSITIYAENEEQFQEYEAMVRGRLEQYHQIFDIYET